MDKDTGTRLAEIADELRAMAQNGLHWAANEYDHARYEKTLSLAAELMSMVDNREAAEIECIFRGDLGIRTPSVGVCAVVFDENGRLLVVQRSDNGKWCMPGGAADVGEPPSAVAVREAWEETGLRVRATRLIGVYDSQTMGSKGALHLYHLDFLCERVGGELALTNETLAYGYFAEEEAMALPLHGTQPFRIPLAFKFQRGEIGETLFH